ncbi:hypothetical protein [Rhodoferax sp.]|uniref:hypothetical protein n=1 Tax=Rhodoferax sp. TaxID=50421 RepID=UPI0025DDBC45|nr:hypothetical protein [Rhodoferax sp.]
MLRFVDHFVSRELQFSAGIDSETGKHFISFMQPTMNRQSDYEVYFFIPENLLEIATKSPASLNDYVNECRNGLHKINEIN